MALLTRVGGTTTSSTECDLSYVLRADVHVRTYTREMIEFLCGFRSSSAPRVSSSADRPPPHSPTPSRKLGRRSVTITGRGVAGGGGGDSTSRRKRARSAERHARPRRRGRNPRSTSHDERGQPPPLFSLVSPRSGDTRAAFPELNFHV
jgi:hypothetical protein